MKNPQLFAVLLLTTCTMMACKSKSPQELIVKKWKITEMTGPLAATMSDSSKQKLYDMAVMEFTKDGKFATTGLSSGTKTGTYSMIANGKQLVSTNTGDTHADTLNILEITTDKMLLEDLKGLLKISLKTK